MLIALICTDKADHLEVRKANRDAHLAYIKDTGVVAMAGPTLDDEGHMAGSIIVLDVESLAQAEAWASNDPYAKANLFSDVQIKAWNKVIG